ncbi:winged helix-turn-helix domain-containing protein [Streptomyces tubbatahanensis]|uniref:Winged helix-turn-helix domain-containing protein n=1 Tax=Streptomyces tubbatahanensis TaxID=2923272 RepID=A0ABY3XXD6_9ACTN|nr:DUF5937 family protein [Streptomyces tubbatahanensis]UNS99039.1 winged helix-turn-helix domain-containing protein [Streptomyces tubbatahanensis]
MTITIRFGPADPLNCRFALSPGWETQAALRALAHAPHGTPHSGWVRRTLPLARSLALDPLWAVLPARGYTPDFLFPAPAAPAATVAEEAARIRATDPACAHAQLTRALAGTPGAARTAVGRDLLADPGAAVETLARAVVRAWEGLLAPCWPRLRALLEADITFRARRLADGGLGRVLAALHPQVTWRDGALRIARRPGHSRVLTGGEGVTLVPSAFVWPGVAAGFEPPAPAAVMYPARGVGHLWSPSAPLDPPRALVRLLGRGRAAVLTALDEPASTSALALRLRLAPSSVSAHLSVLRGAGLLDSCRIGHQVLYSRTALGAAVVAGRAQQPPGPPAGG